MSLFGRRFGAPPAAAVFSPGRVNLIGEHTDYNGGMVLPTALQLGVTVELSLRSEPRLRVASDRFEGTAEGPVGTVDPESWSAHVFGAFAAAGAEGGADVALTSDLPDGAGLSSSAAVAVGVLRALAAAQGHPVDPVATAKTAQQVENDYVGVPCGIMDQMAIALAAPGEALALDTLDLSYETIPLPGSHRFVVLHSGVRRRLTEGRYAQRRRECEAAADALNADHLCRLSPADLVRAEGLAEPLSRRARHCATEHARTKAAAAALKRKDMAAFGRLMSESHASMRDDFEVSLTPIDDLVRTALAEGALGARLTGGGFGGCVVACVAAGDEPAWADRVLQAHPAARAVA